MTNPGCASTGRSALDGRRMNLFSPAIWTEHTTTNGETPGVWIRCLRSEDDGDGVVLCHLEPGAVHEHQSERPTTLLVLDGMVDVGDGRDAWTAPTGTYAPLGDAAIAASDQRPAVALLLSGPRLGEESKSIGSPRHWKAVGAGMVVLPLADMVTEGEHAERTAGVMYLEPGGHVPLHTHATRTSSSSSTVKSTT